MMEDLLLNLNRQKCIVATDFEESSDGLKLETISFIFDSCIEYLF